MRYRADNSNGRSEFVAELLPVLRAHARHRVRDERVADILVEMTLKQAIADVDRCPANGSLILWLLGIMAGIDLVSSL